MHTQGTALKKQDKAVCVCGRGNVITAQDFVLSHLHRCRSGTGEEGKVGRGGCAGRSGWVCVRARLTDAPLTAELTRVACNYSLLFVS